MENGFSLTYVEQQEAFIAELRQQLGRAELLLSRCQTGKEQAEALAEDRASEAAACHDIMAECRNIAGDPHTSTVDAVRSLLARAEDAEAKLAQCQAWRQEDADNLNHCIRAKQQLLDDRSKLRRALAQLVGADTVEELQNMEAIMRVAPAPAKDRAAAIDAIHALIEVQP